MSRAGLDEAFRRVCDAASRAELLDIEHGTSYGTPALLVRGKMFVRVKDEDTLVLRCRIEDKPHLVAAAPDVYFETDHYKGWPAILVRLAAIGEEELAARVADAWRLRRA